MPRPTAVPAVRRRPALMVPVLALAAALIACGKPTLELEERQTFRDASRTQTVEGFVPETTEELSLSLDLQVDAGTVAFRVRDPQGQVRWEGELTGGGSLTDRREFPPVAGPWRLDFQMVGADGRYEVRWLGR
ncbi:MAG TPA: hypothetical protein VHM02_16620 [Thermoanaerobaculia bacterium]|nr:hypothetical protein [Thermoanaerobaculia bacterium]